MKEFFVMVFALLFCSCNMGQGDGMPTPFGWRSAGLISSKDSLNKWGNGYMDIAHTGKYIFVRDGKVSNPQTLKPDNRIFMSMQGSNAWEQIQTPDSVVVYTIYADESGLYVSAYDIGQLWHYDPATKEWKDMNVQAGISEFEFKAKLNVYGITKFNGQLVVAIGNYVAELDYSIVFILLLQPDGTWKDISPPDNYSTDYEKNPFYFDKAVEWRGKLFAIRHDVGTWAYDGSRWEKLPCPEGQISSYTEEPYDAPTAIAVHKDRLYTGQYAYQGVQEVRDDYSRFRVDSNTSTDGTYDYKTPYRIKTLVSTGEHLLVAGIGPGGMPRVYMGDKGEPKGWRYLEQGWCQPYGSCLSSETHGLDVVGDTLYAATWNGVFKFPLSDLEKSIENEESYYYYEKPK